MIIADELMCNRRNIHEINPKNGINGNQPMFNGTLKGLLKPGCLCLSQIKEKFTNAKIKNVAKLVTPAIRRRSPNEAKTMDNTIVVKIAIRGTPVLSSMFENATGKAPSLDIP
jgi:hypothetical protein